MLLFLRGFIVGFLINAPVGPIGILCIRRSFAEGRTVGFISGLGVATVDAIYGLVAGFGLTFISNFLTHQQVWIRLLGGLLLLGIGMKIFRTKSVKEVAPPNVSGLLRAYVSTFFVTFTNPVTFLSIAAVFAGLGVPGSDGNLTPIIALVLGIFIGSTLWWFFVSNSIHFFRRKKTDLELKWVNGISGILITGFGLVILLSLFIR
ncbi:MAG TPA: LysE family transporter [Thermodesulfobacteriota bacterium]|nr:LysE family transporter [Thermodesulfobacteriota bacterium]